MKRQFAKLLLIQECCFCIACRKENGKNMTVVPFPGRAFQILNNSTSSERLMHCSAVEEHVSCGIVFSHASPLDRLLSVGGQGLHIVNPSY